MIGTVLTAAPIGAGSSFRIASPMVAISSLVGAFIGPNLANLTRGWLPVPFAGAYLALVGVALLSLAMHADGTPTSVRDIADRTALPQPYLEQILLAVKGAGLVRSKRGVGGGYVLARDPKDITLAEIVSAVDGPIEVGDFGRPHQNGACDHEGQCVLLAVWADVGEHMRQLLEGQTLADVAAIARGEAPWPDPVT